MTKKLGLDKLEQEQKKLIKNNPRMKMYCLSCGRLINSNYHGELWYSTCFCLINKLTPDKHVNIIGTPDEHRLRKHHATAKCVEIMEGPKKGKFDMVLSYSMLGDLSHEHCNKCKTKEEHKQRKIEDYLGKKWKTIKIDNPNIAKLREQFVEAIHHRVDTDASKHKIRA